MKNKRGGVRTRSSYKKQKSGSCDGGISCPDNPLEEEFGSSSDSGQGVWAELSEGVASNLANTVVSIASFDEGNVMFFACTGIIVKNDPDTKSTSFLTSLSLLRSIEDDRKIFQDMRVVHIHLVLLYRYRFKCAFHTLKVALLDTERQFDSHSKVALLDNERQFDSHSKVVAVGHCFNSGKLMATDGIWTDNPSGDYREELAVSSCQITMTGVGGPLIDFNGDFIGMNFYAKEETPFLPRTKIIELLKPFNERVPLCAKKGHGSTITRFHIPHESDSQVSSRGEQNNKGQKPSICTLCDPECQPGIKDKILNCKRFHTRWPIFPHLGDAKKIELRSNGYPFPLWEDFRRRLVNSFEEEFSEDMLLTKLKRKVASNMPQSKKRCFACTGVVIESKESTTRVLTSASLIRTSDNENMIVVCLPDNRHVPGTLQHYSLNYNVARVARAQAILVLSDMAQG